jgi:hypothetical protein
MKSRKLIPNPLLKRIEFIESKYAKRPEVGEALRGAVKKAIGKDEIDPALSVKWERNLDWAAKAMFDLGKKKDAGELSDFAYKDQLKSISRSFRTAVDPFLDKEIEKESGERLRLPAISQDTKIKLRKGTGLLERRGVPLQELSPKQARQLAARRGKEIARIRRAKNELTSERLAFIKSIGAELFYDFGDGYLALKTPEAKEPLPDEITPQWVDRYARFQNWLGENMRNCLQFFRKTYGVGHGKYKYEILHEGGTLYGIIDDKNIPVAALFFNANGKLIESNGIDNIQPGPEYDKYLEKLSRKMGIAESEIKKAGGIVFPVNVDPVFKFLIEDFSDGYLDQYIDLKREFTRKIQRTLNSTPNFNYKIFEKKMIDYAKNIILRYIDVYEETINNLLAKEIIKDKYKNIIRWLGGRLKLTAVASYDDFIKVIKDIYDEFLKNARNINIYKITYGGFQVSPIKAEYINIINIDFYLTDMEIDNKDSIILNRSLQFIYDRHSKENVIYFSQFFALVKILNEIDGLSQSSSMKSIMKDILKMVSDTARESQGARAIEGNPKNLDPLIKKCRAQWDSYCERPARQRLIAVYNTLKEMKDSKSSKVRSEMQRCLRVAKLERKRFA